MNRNQAFQIGNKFISPSPLSTFTAPRSWDWSSMPRSGHDDGSVRKRHQPERTFQQGVISFQPVTIKYSHAQHALTRTAFAL